MCQPQDSEVLNNSMWKMQKKKRFSEYRSRLRHEKTCKGAATANGDKKTFPMLTVGNFICRQKGCFSARKQTYTTDQVVVVVVHVLHPATQQIKQGK